MLLFIARWSVYTEDNEKIDITTSDFWFTESKENATKQHLDRGPSTRGAFQSGGPVIPEGLVTLIISAVFLRKLKILQLYKVTYGYIRRRS